MLFIHIVYFKKSSWYFIRRYSLQRCLDNETDGVALSFFINWWRPCQSEVSRSWWILNHTSRPAEQQLRDSLKQTRKHTFHRTMTSISELMITAILSIISNLWFIFLKLLLVKNKLFSLVLCLDLTFISLKTIEIIFFLMTQTCDILETGWIHKIFF